MKDRLEKYDVVLQRLTEDKIEMVRNWRNDPKISQFMEFRQEITSEMQKKWFRSIDNERNLYYIIVYKGEEIGLINIKDIDEHSLSGEGGIFIYSDKYLNTDVSYRAHLCLFDYYFEELGYNELRSHILSSNKRAIRFAEFLGSQKIGDKEYSLLKENYESNNNRQRFINKYNKLKNKKND
jgi:RimJ/RimL family protein N-acetyltransferase